jgi:hypothetical protein
LEENNIITLTIFNTHNDMRNTTAPRDTIVHKPRARRSTRFTLLQPLSPSDVPEKRAKQSRAMPKVKILCGATLHFSSENTESKQQQHE